MNHKLQSSEFMAHNWFGVGLVIISDLKSVTAIVSRLHDKVVVTRREKNLERIKLSCAFQQTKYKIH